MLLIPVNADHSISLRRAPEVAQACLEAYGERAEPYVISLRELLGVISAHEWRKMGVQVLTRDDEEIRIHPHYGVFSPVRGEYIDLVLKAPLPAALQKDSIAFDIGVGTGVLSVVLAMRGVQKILATDQSERALVCAIENITDLGLEDVVDVLNVDLFPKSKAALIVCNPPWLPARPSSVLEHAVYDPESQMLKGFLNGLKNHLLPGAEGWLILSDLAEHLGLRTREALLEWIDTAGLKVVERLDTKPRHPKAFDKTDALHAARSKELTSLWRLAAK
jgi:methylase of polypeptide subunit release factors